MGQPVMTDFPIVNALGTLDNPNAQRSASAVAQLTQDSDQLTIDARTLSDAHASGLTAINITLGYTMGDQPPYEHTLHEIEVWDDLIAEHPDDLVQVLRADDIPAARRDSRIGVIYGFQNAVAVGDDLARINRFAKLGVRVIQLTYNQANHIGDGSMAPQNRGLTEFGHAVVHALNDSQIMVDLSHSGETTCLDAIRVSRQPVSINHTGCRALADLPRNKTDEELRLVADRGGFVGIYFMPFLNRGGHATAADVVAHIEHAVDVCGDDHVGIGTDGPVTAIDDLDAYRAQLAEHVALRKAAGVGAAGERADTFPFVVDLRGTAQFFTLIRLLEQRGHNAERIEKILGRNFIEYAARVWTS
jgi:membrane dipeptidase